MTESSTQLINAFTALPAEEKHAVILELARISEGDAGAISDDELFHSGSAVFSCYDKEEASDGEAKTN